MKTRKIILTIWFLLAITCSARAYVDFNDGGYHTIAYTINAHVRVDYDTPGMGTQLDLVWPGRIELDLRAYEDSYVTILGGEIGLSLIAYQNAEVIVSGGWIGSGLGAFDDSHVIFSGGETNYGLAAHGNSQISISGGLIGDEVYAYGNSQIDISAGQIYDDLIAYDSSRVTMSGGQVGDEIWAGFAPADYWDMSLITFEGTNFEINGQSVGYGDFASDYAVPGTDPWGNPCLTGTLTGTLADASELSNTFYIFDDADITFVPEPATLLLLLLGAAFLKKRV